MDCTYDVTKVPPETVQSLGKALDELANRVRADLGESDVAYIARVKAVDKTLEIAGRSLIMMSIEPLGFSLGVLALASHKCLQFSELGHSIIHRAYDRIDPSGRFHSKSFQWDFPIDEASWRYGHNIRHHSYTGIVGKDPDVSYGILRLNSHSPHRRLTYAQLPAALLGVLSYFGVLGNFHYTGVYDLLYGNGLKGKFDFIPDRSVATIRSVLKTAFRKPVAHFARNYVFYPALAGPFFGKVILGNWLAGRMRDAYMGTVTLISHAGRDIGEYPEGTKAKGRHQWYLMQIAAANNFDAPKVLSILWGGMDRHIEHHLFPDLPPNRLRQIAPEVQRLCQEHGIPYKTGSFFRLVKRTIARIAELSFPLPAASKPATGPKPARAKMAPKSALAA